jgi:hypothetical protein
MVIGLPRIYIRDGRQGRPVTTYSSYPEQVGISLIDDLLGFNGKPCVCNLKKWMCTPDD